MVPDCLLQIVISLVNNRPSSNNFSYSLSLQEWTKATNVRLRLMRTKTLLGHLMAVARQDSTVTRRVGTHYPLMQWFSNFFDGDPVKRVMKERRPD